MKDLVIIGAGGFGREIAWLVERINQKKETWNLIGFIDDGLAVDAEVNQYKVIGDSNWLIGRKNDLYVLCAIGNAKTRKTIINKIEVNKSLKFATVIDPSVNISNLVNIGEGSMICAGNNITVNIDIGKHVIINLDCTIGHDVVLDDFVTLYPSVNVSGMTHICTLSEMGTGSAIIQGVKIANNVIVGAGGVVIKDIVEQGIYTGVPVIKKS